MGIINGEVFEHEPKPLGFQRCLEMDGYFLQFAILVFRAVPTVNVVG
jgi:hypothetical protein